MSPTPINELINNASKLGTTDQSSENEPWLCKLALVACVAIDSLKL